MRGDFHADVNTAGQIDGGASESWFGMLARFRRDMMALVRR